jgi:hypothetical protein
MAIQTDTWFCSVKCSRESCTKLIRLTYLHFEDKRKFVGVTANFRRYKVTANIPALIHCLKRVIKSLLQCGKSQIHIL